MIPSSSTHPFPNPSGAANLPGASPPLDPRPADAPPDSRPGPLRSGLRIGNWFGIEIRLEVSWFIIFVLLILSFAGTLALEHPGLSPWTRGAVALGASLLFFGSILFHELMHSVVSLKSGLKVHGITLFFFGGVSHLASEPKRPKDDFLIAVVGPLASAALGAAFLGIAAVAKPIPVAHSVASWLGYVNLGLAAFNLLPGFPLDGGRVLKSLIWAWTGNARKAQQQAIAAGRLMSYGLILVGVILAFGFSRPRDGLWIGFMGWYLLSSAQSGRLQLTVTEILGRLRVRDILRPPEAVVRTDDPMARVVDDWILKKGHRTLLVCDGAELLGLVTLHEIKHVPRNEWELRTIGQIMVPAGQLASVAPEDSLLQAFQRIEERGVGLLPVLAEKALVGVVGREDVLRLLAIHAELGAFNPRGLGKGTP